MSTAYTVMIPNEAPVLNLENARYMILADFFCTWYTDKKPLIQLFNSPCFQEEDLKRLGIYVGNKVKKSPFDLAVIPRDFSTMAQNLSCAKTIICGRLLPSTPLEHLLPDFGGDTLRIYLLYLGPLGRDYEFHWEQLAGLYKFIQKTWHQGKNFSKKTPYRGSYDELAMLEEIVKKRIKQKKPHTALAAVMKFLKDKTKLTEIEVLTIAKLLKPYTPFLSAELVNFITSVKIDDGR